MSQLLIRLIHCLSSKVFIHSPLINHLCNFHPQVFNSFHFIHPHFHSPIHFIHSSTAHDFPFIFHHLFIDFLFKFFHSSTFINHFNVFHTQFSFIYHFHSSNFHLCFSTHPSFIFILILLAFIPHSSIFHNFIRSSKFSFTIFFILVFHSSTIL